MMPEPPELYPLGTRVRIDGHWEWPDGTRGTIANYPDAVQELSHGPPGTEDQYLAAGLARCMKARSGYIWAQWVWFDEPTDDGSGDGPYRGGEVDMETLSRLKE